jgi:hypothetical protein
LRALAPPTTTRRSRDSRALGGGKRTLTNPLRFDDREATSKDQILVAKERKEDLGWLCRGPKLDPQQQHARGGGLTLLEGERAEVAIEREEQRVKGSCSVQEA